MSHGLPVVLVEKIICIDIRAYFLCSYYMNRYQLSYTIIKNAELLLAESLLCRQQ